MCVSMCYVFICILFVCVHALCVLYDISGADVHEVEVVICGLTSM